MKKEVHPEVHKKVIRCACGFEMESESTRAQDIHVEVCSHCHPFFTGEQRFVDSAGRIDRFRKKYAQFSAAK